MGRFPTEKNIFHFRTSCEHITRRTTSSWSHNTTWNFVIDRQHISERKNAAVGIIHDIVNYVHFVEWYFDIQKSVRSVFAIRKKGEINPNTEQMQRSWMQIRIFRRIVLLEAPLHLSSEWLRLSGGSCNRKVQTLVQSQNHLTCLLFGLPHH